MASNSKELVARGYDAVAEAYLDRFSSSAVRDAWLADFAALQPGQARVLALGCGGGVPVAARLVELGHDVTGWIAPRASYGSPAPASLPQRSCMPT